MGRSALLVPRSLKNEMIATLSWIGSEFSLNMIAETFIDTQQGRLNGENCVLSFG